MWSLKNNFPLWGDYSKNHSWLRAFEDFEFRAVCTDRNTPTFAAVMVKKLKLKLPFSCLKLGRKFIVILAGYKSGRYSGQSFCPLYRPANLYYAGTLHSKQKNPARNSNSSNVRNRTGVLFPSNLL
jgi:hypothetical protein